MRKALVSVCLGADSTAVTVPTLVAQVHDDTMTRPQDVQDIYDAIPVSDKELYWIEGTDRRFDGYNFFGIHPVLRHPSGGSDRLVRCAYEVRREVLALLA